MEQNLYQRIASTETLREAWKRVKANKGIAGADGVDVKTFNIKYGHKIRQLARNLRQGTYRPGPLRRLNVPKKSGKTRTLTIPTVLDRVVQASAALVLDELLDPIMSDASFAYRKGRSVEHAISRVMTYRMWGSKWAVDGDIESYFDNIPHDALINTLKLYIPCMETIQLIQIWLKNFSSTGLGIAQGSPISPLLANIYLDPIDKAIHSRRIRLIRFADDFLILTQNEGAANWAKSRINNLLGEKGLRLNEEKTHVVSFADGFMFLGYIFRNDQVMIAPEILK